MSWWHICLLPLPLHLETMLIYWYIHGIVIFVSILSMLFLPLLYSNLVICLFSFTSYLPSSSSLSYPSPSISFPSSPFTLCPPPPPSELNAVRSLGGTTRANQVVPAVVASKFQVPLSLARIWFSRAVPWVVWFRLRFVSVLFVCVFCCFEEGGGVASLSVWNFLGFVSSLLWFLFLFRFVVISSFFANFHLWCVF